MGMFPNLSNGDFFIVIRLIMPQNYEIWYRKPKEIRINVRELTSFIQGQSLHTAILFNVSNESLVNNLPWILNFSVNVSVLCGGRKRRTEESRGKL